MKDQKKAKWILGSSGVIFCALILSQFNDETEADNTDVAVPAFTQQQEENMTEREKELVALDWTNFEIVTMNPQQTMVKSDRKTRRS
ncbi:hypothetical protein [Lysinibacillus antri]|uniref:Uncharacterized protein n=1 Tax=Lysinibacillus antri TaxID=2498145 RepID=A0A3S0RHK3_9BACI|nr:hypothetical protein [Lysinibacillus antri]RUL49015.1 hypothetical protein EK386_16005 [Lysinibacillus antri]TSI04741.1 hypothetical protein FJQ64_13765 [Lysinibacillus sp. BW-2-10]